MTIDYEKLLILNELSEIIRWHNQCLERMRAYRESYPYLTPPNVALMIEENLKENVQMLYNELNNVSKPRSEQKRHICKKCFQAFALSLPSGVCDECRSKVETKPDYGPRALPSFMRPKTEPADDSTLEENDPDADPDETPEQPARTP